jgi:hypothetical protein
MRSADVHLSVLVKKQGYHSQMEMSENKEYAQPLVSEDEQRTLWNGYHPDPEKNADLAAFVTFNIMASMAAFGTKIGIWASDHNVSQRTEYMEKEMILCAHLSIIFGAWLLVNLWFVRRTLAELLAALIKCTMGYISSNTNDRNILRQWLMFFADACYGTGLLLAIIGFDLVVLNCVIIGAALMIVGFMFTVVRLSVPADRI